MNETHMTHWKRADNQIKRPTYIFRYVILICNKFIQFNGPLSGVLISHHITFLWGPPHMLYSSWLSFGSYGTIYSVSVCLINDIDKAWTKYIHEGVNQKKKKKPYIQFELCSCLHYLNLRKSCHGDHYCRLKTDSKFVNIFNCN